MKQYYCYKTHAKTPAYGLTERKFIYTNYFPLLRLKAMSNNHAFYLKCYCDLRIKGNNM